MKILVLGAGPAGTSSAIKLLKAGHSVDIVDRSSFPRHAPGETLHPGIEPLLKDLGIFWVVQNQVAIRHEGIEVSTHSDFWIDYYNEEQGWRGFQIVRETFDSALLDQAKKLGANIFLNEKPRHLDHSEGRILGLETANHYFTADYYVDATGRNRWISRMLGHKTREYGKRMIAHYGYYRDVEQMRFPRFEYSKNGWLWRAQIQGNVFNWVFVTSGDPLKKNWLPEQLKSKNHSAKQIVDVTWRLNEKPANLNYFAVGDAAFTTDPSTSHGVLKALMSGMMSAHLINLGPLPDKAEIYTNWTKRWFFSDYEKMRDFKRPSP